MMRENICQVEFNLSISQAGLFGKDSCYKWYPQILYPGVCKAVPKRVFMHIACMDLCAHVFCVSKRNNGVAEGAKNLGTETDEGPGR